MAVGERVTVAELIVELQKCPQDATVMTLAYNDDLVTDDLSSIEMWTPDKVILR